MASINDFADVKSSPNPEAGLGLITNRKISAGTVWWTRSASNTLILTYPQIHNIRLAAKRYLDWALFLTAIERFSYYNSNTDVLNYCLDNLRYTNHSDNPSCEAIDQFDDMDGSTTIRDMEEGEEICENYWTYSVCNWSYTCVQFLRQMPPPEHFTGTESRIYYQDPTKIELSKAQLQTLLNSHLATELDKALLKCLISWGIMNVKTKAWVIDIPKCDVKPKCLDQGLAVLNGFP